MMTDSMTKKCLYKLTKEELFEAVLKIKEDGVCFDSFPNEIYASNQEILEHAKENFGIE